MFLGKIACGDISGQFYLLKLNGIASPFGIYREDGSLSKDMVFHLISRLPDRRPFHLNLPVQLCRIPPALLFQVL